MIIIGGNDVAEEFAQTLLKLCWEWHFDMTASRLFMVEQIPRMGYRAFRPSNTDFFTGLPCSNDDGEALYKERIDAFNDILKSSLL